MVGSTVYILRGVEGFSVWHSNRLEFKFKVTSKKCAR